MKRTIIACVLFFLCFCPDILFGRGNQGLTNRVDEDRFQVELQKIVTQISDNTKRLTYISQDLLKIIGSYQYIEKTDVDYSDIHKIQLTMQLLATLSTGFDSQAELLDVSILIEAEFKEIYYKERLDSLVSTKEETSLSIYEIQRNSGAITNNEALIIINRATNIINSTTQLIDRCIGLLKAHRTSI